MWFLISVVQAQYIDTEMLDMKPFSNSGQSIDWIMEKARPEDHFERSVKISNMSTKEKKISFYVSDALENSSSFSDANTNFVVKSREEYSGNLASFVQLSDQSITLKPYESKVIKARFVLPEQLTPGLYKGAIIAHEDFDNSVFGLESFSFEKGVRIYLDVIPASSHSGSYGFLPPISFIWSFFSLTGFVIFIVLFFILTKRTFKKIYIFFGAVLSFFFLFGSSVNSYVLKTQIIDIPPEPQMPAVIEENMINTHLPEDEIHDPLEIISPPSETIPDQFSQETPLIFPQTQTFIEQNSQEIMQSLSQDFSQEFTQEESTFAIQTQQSTQQQTQEISEIFSTTQFFSQEIMQSLNQDSTQDFVVPIQTRQSISGVADTQEESVASSQVSILDSTQAVSSQTEKRENSSTSIIEIDPELAKIFQDQPDILKKINETPGENVFLLPSGKIQFAPQNFSLHQERVVSRKLGRMYFVQRKKVPWNMYVSATDMVSTSGILPASTLRFYVGDPTILKEKGQSNIKIGTKTNFLNNSDKIIFMKGHPTEKSEIVFSIHPRLEIRIPPGTAPGKYKGNLTITSL